MLIVVLVLLTLYNSFELINYTPIKHAHKINGITFNLYLDSEMLAEYVISVQFIKVVSFREVPVGVCFVRVVEFTFVIIICSSITRQIHIHINGKAHENKHQTQHY